MLLYLYRPLLSSQKVCYITLFSLLLSRVFVVRNSQVQVNLKTFFYSTDLTYFDEMETIFKFKGEICRNLNKKIDEQKEIKTWMFLATCLHKPITSTFKASNDKNEEGIVAKQS